MQAAPPDYTIRRAPATPEGRAASASVLLPYLAKHEAANNLPLSILDAITRGHYPDALLVYAEDPGGDVAAALLRTPPHRLLVPHGGEPPAREALLRALAEQGEELPGMVGPLPEVGEAAAWWSARTGLPYRRSMLMGVYRLWRVLDRRRAAGSVRRAAASDEAAVASWLEAFQLEAMGRLEQPSRELWASFLDHEVRRLYLWEHGGRPVSLAGVSGRTPNGVRIGPVYTPPDHRRRGYAEALVAAVSRDRLAAGARFCFLYTDLGYATTNSIYRAVGYEPIGEAATIEFGPAGDR